MIDSLLLQVLRMNKNYPVKNPAAWLYVWQLAKRLLFVFLLLFLTRIGFYLYNKYFFTSLAWTNPDICGRSAF